MKDFIKKYNKNFILVFLIGFGVYFFVLLKHDIRDIFDKIKNINIIYIFLVLVLFFLYSILEAVVLYLFTINKVKGIKFKDSFRLNLSTQFFNNITPFASGGQPFQIFYLNARGIKVKDSTSIVLMNFITYSIAFDIVGFVCLFFKYQYFNSILNGQGYLLIIGFSINILMTVLTFILAFSKRIYHILVEVVWLKIIKWPILKRFKLENKTSKIRQTIDDFNREIKELNNHKILWFQSVGLHILRIIIVYTIPLFIFMSLGETIPTNNVVNLIIGAFFVAMVMSYIPSPGASGGAEGLFYLVFAAFFAHDDTIITAMLLWRFITYYLYLILGFISLITLNYDKNLKEINYISDDNESDILIE